MATTATPGRAAGSTGRTTMRVARFAAFGDPSVLHVAEVPTPGGPDGDEILVRVAASSVNGTDTGLRRGDLKIATWGRMPFVPGFDLAGEVVACGPAVTAFRPGEHVMALLGHGGGGQAEFVALRQGRAARAPSAVPLTHAAAIPLAGLTALQAVYGKAGLQARRRGARVLVVGASGGIGSFAVQLAKIAAAHVTALASGPKLDFARDLGADEGVARHEHDVTRLGETWDVVVDTPGALRFAAARHLLAPGGVFVSTRPVSGDAVRGLAPPALRRGPGRFAAVMTKARSQDLAHLAALVDAGSLRVPVDSVLPLEQVAQAHRRAEGQAAGKVVVEVAAPL